MDSEISESELNAIKKKIEAHGGTKIFHCALCEEETIQDTPCCHNCNLKAGGPHAVLKKVLTFMGVDKNFDSVLSKAVKLRIFGEASFKFFNETPKEKIKEVLFGG